MSQLCTDYYLQELRKEKRKSRNVVESLLKFLPERLSTLLHLQNKDGANKGQWHQTPELVKLLGGHVPDPPSGVSEWRWWTALAMAFIRRHPVYHDQMEQVYHMAEYWIPDPSILEVARKSLPPLDGSWLDYIGVNNEYVDSSTHNFVKQGRWDDSLQIALQERGYMAFTKDMGDRDPRTLDEIFELPPDELRRGTRKSVDGLRTSSRQISTGGSRAFTAEAAKAFQAQIMEAAANHRSWLTDDEIAKIWDAKDRKRRLRNEQSLQHTALSKEFDEFPDQDGKVIPPR